MPISTITYNTILWINVPKVPTDFLWTLTWAFVVLGVIYFIAVFVFKNKLNSHYIKTKSKHAQLAPIISNFLFHSTEDPKEEQKEYVNLKIEIREFLNNKRFRKILSTILFDLQKDVAGATKERLFKLYRELGLHHDSYAKLNSWRWQTVAKGLNELSQMQVEEAFQMIAKFLNDRRGLVRKQAEIAIIALRHDGINHLLDTTTFAISEWQQLKLIEAIDQLENYKPPKYCRWLISQNNDVVLLALRLIRHFNQNEAAKSIIELVKHKDDEIKLAAISCIRDFNFKQALKPLKNVFWQSSDTVKIQILNVIAQLGDSDNLSFLNLVVLEDENFMVRTKAESTINSIVPEAILPSKDLLQTEGMVTKKRMAQAAKKSLKKGKQLKKKKNNVASDNIEVTEIEVFDVVPKIIIAEDDIVDSNLIEPEFEIGVLNDLMDASLNDSLGLMESAQAQDFEETPNNSEIESAYEAMSFEERAIFVNTIDEVSDTRETAMLEYIMENEADAEVRFQAFNILKRINARTSKQTIERKLEESKEQLLPLEYHSIFFDLYKRCADKDSKKILIREAKFIGDTKDLAFLKSLLRSEKKSLKPFIDKAIAAIEKRCGISETILEKAVDYKVETTAEKITTTQEINAVHGPESLKSEPQEGRLPLEFCFLNLKSEEETVANIMDSDLFFDFELSEEFTTNKTTYKNRIEN